jgi:predicted dithiol-disulfide oxidoreductase (DUF899 family)
MTSVITESSGRYRIASREEWLTARKALLTKEKELTRRRDALATERRALPWVRVEKRYVFRGPEGEVTLADLFEGRSQLFIKHFMLGPGQVGQCVGCSFEVDHLDGILVHLENHDVSYAVVAARSDRGDRGRPRPHGMALHLGLVVPERLQLRLRRVLQT